MGQEGSGECARRREAAGPVRAVVGDVARGLDDAICRAQRSPG